MISKNGCEIFKYTYSRVELLPREGLFAKTGSPRIHGGKVPSTEVRE